MSSVQTALSSDEKETVSKSGGVTVTIALMIETYPRRQLLNQNQPKSRRTRQVNPMLLKGSDSLKSSLAIPKREEKLLLKHGEGVAAKPNAETFSITRATIS